MKRSELIPRAPVGRLIARAGAERVSNSAADALAEILEDIALDISRQAAQISRHAGRKTVNGGDVKLAGNSILQNA